MVDSGTQKRVVVGDLVPNRLLPGVQNMLLFTVVGRFIQWLPSYLEQLNFSKNILRVQLYILAPPFFQCINC